METTTLKIPHPKNLFYTLGRYTGLYRRGIESVFSTTGARAPVTDESAWMNPLFWGQGLANSRKPRSKADYIAYFQNWVYICSKLNAQSVGSIPMRLYVAKQTRGKAFKTIGTRPVARERLKYLHSQENLGPYLTKSEEVEEVTDHIFLDLMQNVNPYHNRRDLREYTTMFSDITGEAYWLLIKKQVGGTAIPHQIYAIPSHYIDPIYGDSLENAIKGYKYKRGNVEIEFKYDDIIMFTTPHPDNVFRGFSCVQGVADAVYIGSQMNAFEEAIFENRAKLGGIFTSAENISEVDRLRLKERMAEYSGANKAGKSVILPKGIEFKRDVMTPEEINFIEGRKLNREEICAAFDVPFGVFDVHANRATAEAADFRHAKHGVKPRCDRVDEKLNERLLPMYGNESNRLFVASDDPVPQNRELLMKERTAYVHLGLPINRVLADLGEDPVEGGDEPLVDGRLKSLSQVLEPPQPPPQLMPPPGREEKPEDEDDDEDRDDVERQMRDALKNILSS